VLSSSVQDRRLVVASECIDFASTCSPLNQRVTSGLSDAKVAPGDAGAGRYADQDERDYQQFVKAIRSGPLPALEDI
jgi:hypothetical protein